jgi:ATP-dependent helicase/nuclease subunit A
MTRAAQRLIVAGHATSKRRPPDCWYDLVHVGLADALVEAPAPFRGDETILRFGEGLRAEDIHKPSTARAATALPGWLISDAKPETIAPALNPSHTGGISRGDEQRALEGRLAHAMLEMLPRLAPDLRPGAATAYLDIRGGSLAESLRATLASKVLAAIGAPELRMLFGPSSRSEVALAGLLTRPGRPDLPYSGRLDRLVATGEGVLIVDFKLGEKPDRPASAHVAQLALYRAGLQSVYSGSTVRAALVYLDGPALARIADEELDAALDRVAAASDAS